MDADERGLAPRPSLAILDAARSRSNVDAHHHCNLCRLGSSLHYFGASHSLAAKQGRSNTTHDFPYRASGKRMRVRISAHPLARSLGSLALGPLHSEDVEESISRKHGEL